MKVKDGVIGFVVGDALGVPVEFITRQELKNNPVTDMREYGTHMQSKGTFSDDSSMTFCTMESIIDKRRIDYIDIMNKFTKWYDKNYWTAHGRVFDVGNTTSDAIEDWNTVLDITPVECGSGSEYSNGNGSLMRMLPLAYYLHSKKIKTGKRISSQCSNLSSLTHGHKLSKDCCTIYVNIAMRLMDGMNIEQAYDKTKEKFGYLNRILKMNASEFKNLSENEIISSGYVVNTLKSVLWVLLNSNSYKEAVLKAVNLGGDTDTIGALVGGLAGIQYGFKSIPKEWINCLAKKDNIFDLCNRFEKVLGVDDNE